MKVVLSHPTGNNFVRALLSGLLEADLLSEFNTSVAINSKSKWVKLLSNGVRHELLRRTFPIPSSYIRTRPFLETARILMSRVGFTYITRHERGWASMDAVYQDLDKAVSKRLAYLKNKDKIDAVYAYEDGALETFKQAKRLGLRCIYDLPIAYWQTSRELMAEEAERLPNWAVTLGGGIMDSAVKLERKTYELELADVVIGPGQFVKDSLPAWASNKQVVIAPFGSPESHTIIEGKRDCYKEKGNRLRILFAGSLGQRKGLGDLFAAMRLINSSNVELVLMGSLQAPMNFYRSQFAHFTYEPGRPHYEVLALMRSCDVFCLPSIVEGRALVMQEAMSQGLPIIITPNTGGADLVKEGQTGFLIPVRSPDAIADKISWFLENRSKIPEMGKIAQEHAANYTWDSYKKIIMKSLKEI